MAPNNNIFQQDEVNFTVSTIPAAQKIRGNFKLKLNTLKSDRLPMIREDVIMSPLTLKGLRNFSSAPDIFSITEVDNENENENQNENQNQNDGDNDITPTSTPTTPTSSSSSSSSLSSLRPRLPSFDSYVQISQFQ